MCITLLSTEDSNIKELGILEFVLFSFFLSFNVEAKLGMKSRKVNKKVNADRFVLRKLLNVLFKLWNYR